MKRTTLLLHDQRLKEIRLIAGHVDRTMSEIVDEMLADGIARFKNKSKKRPKIILPTFEMGLAAVNIADRDQLEELMSD